MKVGLVGFPGSGKSSVFGALTGLAVETGFASRSDKANLGVVKVPDPRVDALAGVFQPKKKVYAEITFRDLGGGREGLDRAVLNSMREVDALAQVLRGFENAAGDAPDPLRELRDLETETILADLEIVEQRLGKLAKDKSTKATDINVDTKNGVVTLNGAVASEAERAKAELNARTVKRVVEVENNLRVAAK